MAPGDIVLVVREGNHEMFQRKGCDLVMKKEISLREALTGVCFSFEHLDGHRVIVRSAPGAVVGGGLLQVCVCGCVRRINVCGMCTCGTCARG
jgi:DnaJ family protein A protein 2